MRHLPASKRWRDIQCEVESAQLSIVSWAGKRFCSFGTGMPSKHGEPAGRPTCLLTHSLQHSVLAGVLAALAR